MGEIFAAESRTQDEGLQERKGLFGTQKVGIVKLVKNYVQGGTGKGAKRGKCGVFKSGKIKGERKKKSTGKKGKNMHCVRRASERGGGLQKKNAKSRNKGKHPKKDRNRSLNSLTQKSLTNKNTMMKEMDGKGEQPMWEASTRRKTTKEEKGGGRGSERGCWTIMDSKNNNRAGGCSNSGLAVPQKERVTK